ncbi:MAG: FdhF/YdeP family oxidoreductase [Planctomycetes bacterium]|nr:FdhF/YdeP family oxidoreductase [Planctomycetota bacterium]
MRQPSSGGGWPAIFYAIRKARQGGGLWRMYKALRTRNTCKTCALGMGGQKGGMVNEKGRFPEVCKKSIQAMAADMQGGLHPHFVDDFDLEKLRGFSSRELEAAGRLTEPLYAGPLDRNYRTISWDEALKRIVEKLKGTDPDESFFYFSGRSSNEAGFLLQLFARLYGTNNVNNCSYYCHQASGVGLASVTGSGTATVVLADIDQCDLLFLIGANPASNHPRLMRNIIELRRRGGKVIVINPLRELGLVRFKVPSDVRSLLFGSKIADVYVQPHIGGDIAFLVGVAKAVMEQGKVDDEFVDQYTDGWEAFKQHVEALSWETILDRSGIDRVMIDEVAQIYAASKRTIFCWAMGITHHAHGVENVQMIANLAMTRGMLGRPGCGLLPLRGHSNVQGMGSMGVTPKLKEAVFKRLQDTLNVQLPTTPGMDTLGSILAAEEDGIRFAWCLGGNLYGSNPDSTFAARALSKIDMVLYLSTTLNTGHARGRGRETIILPVLARDEESQSTTQESMFSYVRLSDGGEARLDGPRSEVQVVADIAQRVLGGDGPVDWEAMRRHGTIRQAIAKIIPGYEKIGEIDETKEEFYIAGRTFHEPKFATDTGRAKFNVVDLPVLRGNGEGELRLMTVRSEGQFNTVVYEEEDIYRGQERRDVVMLHATDIERMNLRVDQRVTVRSDCGAILNLLVRSIEICPGNAVMYYPESNVLIPKVADPKSKTPAFKNTVVRIEA